MNLLTESLWGDEAFSAILVQKPLGEILSVIVKDTSPPLMYFLQFLWVRVFGISEIALRSLSVFLVLITSFFVWKLSRLFTKSKIVSFLLALVVLVTPFSFTYAFEARMYSLLILTVTASTYFFLKKSWKLYVLFTLAALYTHNIAIFVVLSEGLIFLFSDFTWKKPKMWLKQLSPFLAIVLLYLPWLVPLIFQLTRISSGGGFWLGKPSLNDGWEFIKKVFTGGVEEKFRPLVAFLGAGLLILKDWKKMEKQGIKLILIVILPPLIAFIFSQFATPIFYDRYLTFTFVGISLVYGVGLRKLAYPFLVGLLIIYALTSFNLFQSPHKKPFRDLAAYVKSSITPNDYLININGEAHHLWESKYYGVPAPIYLADGPLPLYVGTAQMTKDDTITSLPKVKGRIGTISSEPLEKVKLPGYKILGTHQFDGLNFIWWKAK